MKGGGAADSNEIPPVPLNCELRNSKGGKFHVKGVFPF